MFIVSCYLWLVKEGSTQQVVLIEKAIYRHMRRHFELGEERQKPLVLVCGESQPLVSVFAKFYNHQTN